MCTCMGRKRLDYLNEKNAASGMEAEPIRERKVTKQQGRVLARNSAGLLIAAEPDEGDAESDDNDAEPSIAADALVEKELCAKRSRGVAEGAERHDEADGAEGKNRQK